MAVVEWNESVAALCWGGRDALIAHLTRHGFVALHWPENTRTVVLGARDDRRRSVMLYRVPHAPPKAM